MKQLHNHSLHTDINQLLNQLDTKLDQMDQLRNAIVELVSNQDSFTGATGNSIRTYYQNIHLPFISFYRVSLENYKSSLQKLRETSLDLEVDKNGVIMQKFLEGELTDSLDRTKRKAIDLVDEANSTFSSISDIVLINHLNADNFTSSMDEAQKATDDTIEDLFDFDSKNSEGLETVGDDIQLMEQYVAEMESMVKDGTLSVEAYTPIQSKLSLAHSSIKHSLESSLNTHNSMSLTIKDQLEATRLLYTTNNYIVTGENGKAASAYVVSPKSTNEYEYEYNLTDGWEDGVGNTEVLANINLDDKDISLNTSASIVNTEYKDEGLENLKAKVLYGETKFYAPYGFDSLKDNFLYGQHIGQKIEAGVGKIEVSHDNSPLSSTINFGQVEAKTNYEDYTASAGINASIAKIEFKLEPFNFFGYDALEEWFGIEKDPYLGFDVLLGSAGVGGSIGQETGIYASLGLGFGSKFGIMPEEE
ncbi:T7SS effector LXG polymorphic toxin [Terribacillus saccharophilus]|uniref:T7SS effector LXG polymorphic toxin n=1 Tax=Terribacillus saccharophilus TaxID=361277 RepID=UPI003982470B